MANITPKEGEEVLMHLHKSFFALKKQLAIFSVAIISAILLFVFLYKYPVASVMAIILLIISFVYAFYYFLIWFYDVYIITNIRVVTNAKTRLFGHDFADFSYDEVTDITYSIKGILATVFQCGTVMVLLENGQTRELKNISTPGIVQETLKNLVDVTNNKKYH